MKNLLRFLPVADILLAPFIYPCAWLLKNVRHAGVQRLPNCKNVLMKIGVFPIRNHYYEPQFDNRKTIKPLSQDRTLPGIDWNTTEQLNILSEFLFSQELSGIPKKNRIPLTSILIMEHLNLGMLNIYIS